MGPASYIGRVGGLAVALGVGTAIAMGHGIAAAETPDSASAPSDSSTSDNSTSDSSSTSDSKTTDKDESKDEDESKESDVDGSDTSEEDAAAEPEEPSDIETEEPAEETEETDEFAEETDLPDGELPEAQEETVDEELAEEQVIDKVDKRDSTNGPASSPAVAPPPDSTTATPLTNQSPTDPASTKQEVEAIQAVVTFVDARDLAASGPLILSPMMAARMVEDTPVTTPDDPDLLTAAVEILSGVVDTLLDPLAGNSPVEPAAPLAWALLAVTRRDVDAFIDALAGAPTEDISLAAVQTMSLALAAAPTPPPTARPAEPDPLDWVSASTQFIDWVTGNNPANNTQFYYGVTGTDLGIMWDNGMIDNPATEVNEHQILIAFGDTFGIGGLPSGNEWRSNILFRSIDANLADGLSLAQLRDLVGTDFGTTPVPEGPNTTPYQNFAKQIIGTGGLPAGITLIPTAGIAVPTPGTMYGVTQYISFMSVTHWGAPGQWTTNYSAIAYSVDNGENWTVAPQTVRYNNAATGNQNFQQMAFVRPGDGFVYVYGTPNGRNGAAYVARVAERDILDLSKYEYYRKAAAGGWFGIGATPAGWSKGNPATAATPIFGQEVGACGAAGTGNSVSEMSVQYNQQLEKYVVLHGDRFNNIIMRTSDRPEGAWSGPKVLMRQQNGGIYAPMMHPWSPSTQGTGNELYWNLSLWSDYNVMLMKTDLSKVK